MRANGRKRNNPSPTKAQPITPSGSGKKLSSSLSPPGSASVLDREFITEEFAVLDDLEISSHRSPNPRSFPYSVKQQCWEKAEKVPGRDPDRWRRDALGNIVFRKLVGCPGCLCHDYDHIIPYSKNFGFLTSSRLNVIITVGRDLEAH